MPSWVIEPKYGAFCAAPCFFSPVGNVKHARADRNHDDSDHHVFENWRSRLPDDPSRGITEGDVIIEMVPEQNELFAVRGLPIKIRQ